MWGAWSKLGAMNRRRMLWIGGIALALRLIYLVQISDLPWFDVPLIDGANYVGMARAIAAGHLLGGKDVFWQPPLYPYFLAVILALSGSRMWVVDVVQACLGTLSCLLVYAIGRRVMPDRGAFLAGLIMAVYGPLIHFDVQPLIPVLHIALVLCGLLFLLRGAGIRAASRAPRRDWLLGGLAWGLAAIATPNILLAVPAVAVWIALRPACEFRDGPPHRPGLRRPVALFLIGVAAPVALVAARNLAVSGEPVLISSNGGINFYIGNNPDYERTIRIRPGGEFERLAQQPENLGITGAMGRSRFFAGRAFDFLLHYPREALRLYVRKARDLVAGREIPRNEEIDTYRRHSTLLWLLVWRWGIAFPFGVVAPLALAGALLPRGVEADGEEAAGRRLLLIYGSFYALSILLFFPTDRYRLPLVPVAALFAGRLLGASRADWRRPRILAALLCGLVLFNLDAGVPTESWPEEEALNRAYALRVKGRLDEAREEYLRALVLNPRRVDPYNALAAMAAQRGDWEEATERYRQLLRVAPDFVEVRRWLGEGYQALGRGEEARREWEIAIHLAPGAGLALADLCLSYAGAGRARDGEPYCRRAVQARPDLPETHFARAVVARALGDPGLARRELTEAVRLFPPGSPGLERARRMLDHLGG
jgi:tetratricopeptide (TPR) repeat protein